MKGQTRTSIERLRKASLRWLTLLSAPLSISLSAIIVTNLATSIDVHAWLVVITFASLAISLFLYLLGYTRAFDKKLVALSRRRRSLRYRNPYVLILDGTVYSDPNEIPATPLHTDRSPIDWRTPLAQMGWEIEIGPSSVIETDHPPDMVVNPFGEVYPESDFLSNSSASSIRRYVWDGGVYVNVAGIPFWYRYDTRTGRRETAGRVEGIFEGRAKWISLFHDTFPNLDPSSEPKVVRCHQLDEEKHRFGDIASAGGEDTVGMFRANPLNPPRLIPMLRDAEEKHCIIGAYQFGDGAFIFASLVIVRSNRSFDKAIAAIKGWAEYELKSRTP